MMFPHSDILDCNRIFSRAKRISPWFLAGVLFANHGDGAKFEDLGEIMAADVPELWGASLHREWHTGHVHHLQVKELRGCTARSHRTLAGRDHWHFHSGYRSGRSLEALTYHADYGLDSIAIVGIERVRAALAA